MAQGQGRSLDHRRRAGGRLRVALVHTDAAEARRRARPLAARGHQVRVLLRPAAAVLRGMVRPPDVFVISLDTSPSVGRDIALYLRTRLATRRTPIVFARDPTRSTLPRELPPEAPVVSWAHLGAAVRRAAASPPPPPVVQGVFAGYRGTPLPKKLGIRSGCRVALLGAPSGFRASLGSLPPRVALSTRPAGACDVVVLFAPSHARLQSAFRAATAHLAPKGRLWIAWPKKTSGRATDLGERVVRAFGLDAGYVDYKIAALDSTWSGLCFAKRRAVGAQ